jgi:hypothetical protein
LAIHKREATTQTGSLEVISLLSSCPIQAPLQGFMARRLGFSICDTSLQRSELGDLCFSTSSFCHVQSAAQGMYRSYLGMS